jgi:hypothetical protein
MSNDRLFFPIEIVGPWRDPLPEQLPTTGTLTPDPIPATVTLTNPTQVTTVAIFQRPGVYRFRLVTTSASFTVSVNLLTVWVPEVTSAPAPTALSRTCYIGAVCEVRSAPPRVAHDHHRHASVPDGIVYLLLLGRV